MVDIIIEMSTRTDFVRNDINIGTKGLLTHVIKTVFNGYVYQQ